MKPTLTFITALLLAFVAHADDGQIIVHADRKLFTLSDMMIGANMEDLHYQMVGGFDSQMLHGESFFEHSLTELAPRKAQLDGFTTVNGLWTVTNGVVTVVVRPSDGTPWVEAGLAGGQPPGMPSDSPAKDPGARMTSLAIVESAHASFRFAPGDDLPASLIAHVHPNHSDNGWNWYSGYTVELDPKAQKVRLLASQRASRHQELASAPVPIARDVWIPVALRVAGKQLIVRVGDRDVITCQPERLLPPGHFGIVARGKAQIRDLPVALRPNPLLNTPGDALSLRWVRVQSGAVCGTFAFDPDGWHPGLRSQRISYESGTGEFGCDNAGLKRSGIALRAGRKYEGFVRVKAAQPTELWVSLRGHDGKVLAEQKLVTGRDEPTARPSRNDGSGTGILPVSPPSSATGAITGRMPVPRYERLAFTLTPSASDDKGRFAITLRKPGAITVGYAFLQPGEWGRYKGLPVRKDLAEALLAQGIRVLRFNGGMIEVPGYRWKNLRGPRDERPPYDGFYDRYCSSGFGPAEVVAFGKAAGLPVIPALNLDETSEDVADFVATCRPQFYQVANESRFDAKYVAKFKLVAEAVWKVVPDITLVTTSTGGRGNDLHLELAEFARARGKRIMFDCHSFKGAAAVDGIAAFARWLKEKAPEMSVGILEFNAGAFDFQRGLNHALEMNATHRHGDVIRAVGTPNVSQPWEVYQSDWKAVLWTQGNIYYTGDKVWFQPAYYVDQMIANAWAPDAVAVEAPATLDVFAAKTGDGSKLVLRVVNNTGKAQPVRFDIQGFTPGTAHATTLAHDDLTAFNTLSQPERIKPVTTECSPTTHSFPPYSFTVIELSLSRANLGVEKSKPVL